jgi:hypothetical protein
VLTFDAAGQGPFGTGPSDMVLYRVVFTPPDTSGVPAELRPLVERCLAKDPAQRPGTAQLLAGLGTAPPASGWLPAPITQALPSHPPSEPLPAEPAAADVLPAPSVTQLAAPCTGIPDSKMPKVTPGDMLAAVPAGARGGCSHCWNGAMARSHACGCDLPRAFRTADLWLIHAADCCSRYSLWTCCGVRY